MNGFIGIRWCRLVREVDMHLIMRRLGCLHVNENRDEWVGNGVTATSSFQNEQGARRVDWAPGPSVLVLFPLTARSLTWRTVHQVPCIIVKHLGQPALLRMVKIPPRRFSLSCHQWCEPRSLIGPKVALSPFGSLTSNTVSAGASSLDIASTQYAPVFISNL